VRDDGLDEPVRQLEVRAGAERYFLDYAFPNRRLTVELDGFAKLSTKAAKQGLLARDTTLRLAGWTVLHFTWEDVRLRPEWVLESVHLALGRPPASSSTGSHHQIDALSSAPGCS